MIADFKLTDEQVILIYYSSDTAHQIQQQYNVGNDTIYGIKNQRYYRNITKYITELPGTCSGSNGRFIPNEIIVAIFLFSGTAKEYKDKFNVGIQVVKNIKFRYTYKNITQHLSDFGEIRVNKLTWNEVCSIRASDLSTKSLAEQYNISGETVRNIQSNKTRTFK